MAMTGPCSLLLLAIVSSSSGFNSRLHPPSRHTRPLWDSGNEASKLSRPVVGHSDGIPGVDRQADAKYGRGSYHISADLNEGDIVVFQDGTWFVDGTPVGEYRSACARPRSFCKSRVSHLSTFTRSPPNSPGDGSFARARYMQVDTIQLVWTHDCEHGVINGFEVLIANDDESVCESGSLVKVGSQILVTNDYIQVGPEQVLARIPTAITKKENLRGATETTIITSCAEFRPDDELVTS
ncbi:hypothetical protein ACHAWF_010204 [Thalassiosira exigua]